MKSLFEIGDEFAQIHALLHETGGELTPEIEGHVTAWLESLADEEAAKMDGYAAYIKFLDMEAVAAKAEAEQWAKRAQVRTNAAKRLKDRVRDHLTATGRTKVTSAKGVVISVQANGGKPPLEVDTVDPATVPDHLCRVVRSLDGDAVRAAIEAGETLPFARLGDRGTHLRIRV